MKTHEYRAYGSMYGPTKEYRFNGREISGYPKNLEFLNKDTNKWEPCPNVNIHKRIQNENFNTCPHEFDRYTIKQMNCKNCGRIISVEEYIKFCNEIRLPRA